MFGKKDLNSSFSLRVIISLLVLVVIATSSFFFEYSLRKKELFTSIRSQADVSLPYMRQILSDVSTTTSPNVIVDWLLVQQELTDLCVYSDSGYLKAGFSALSLARNNCPKNLMDSLASENEILLDITNSESNEVLGALLLLVNMQVPVVYAAQRSAIYGGIVFVLMLVGLTLLQTFQKRGYKVSAGPSLNAQFSQSDRSPSEKQLTQELIDAFRKMGTHLEVRNNKILQESTLLKSSTAQMNSVLAHVAHELRNPIHAILNYSDMGVKTMESESGKTKELADYFRLIRESSSKVIHLISSLLEVSKIENGVVSLRIEKINLLSVVNRTIEELSPLLNDKQIKLEVNAPDQQAAELLKTVFCDAFQVNLVLGNLLCNALEHSPKGGKVMVSFSSAKLSLDDGIHAKDLKAIKVLIEDSGVGFAPNEFEEVFLPFHQGTNSHFSGSKKGCGLGLTLCREIINAHHGCIWAGNSKIGGALLSFILPCEETGDESAEFYLPKSQRTKHNANDLRSFGEFSEVTSASS